jgi:4-amino-4-deoxy-L-arabinose transferase-like glycosyltransferase
MIKNSPVLVVIFLLFLICLRIAYDFLNGIEYHYDEAQYWVWSQNPSLSYLTKGPFVASIISLSNSIFGQSYLGLKFFSLLAYIGTIIFISFSSIVLKKDKNIGKTALLITGLSPAVFFLGGVASTDAYLFLFLSLVLFCYIKF